MMYLDYILFAISGALLLVALILIVWLVRSRKRSREYRRTLRTETERVDIISTLRNTELLSTTETQKPYLLPNQLAATLPTKQTAYADTAKTVPLSSADDTVFTTGTNTTLSSHDEQKAEPRGEILDFSPLHKKYELLKEIHGGGMSRIFLARHATLGNEWVVKFVESTHAELANEAEVLKKMNHISLPQIIDIFQNSQGTFLVERYIEGYPLDQVMRLGEIKEGLIFDWVLQLAQVLNYLHNLETPIIHCDLKPSNIMVTHDNRLVLIDFGISKRQGIDERSLGLTYRYAAPEQFKPSMVRSERAQARFGILPPEHGDWKIDPRTDLYSTGVILYELAVGDTPGQDGINELRNRVSSSLAEVIGKCLEIDPANRFQSAQELIDALEQLKSHQTIMVRSLLLRRVAAVCCGVSLAAALGTTASATYINQRENLSMVDMDPGHAVVTAQQSVQILLQKTAPDGNVTILEPTKFQWSYSEDNIARLDGDRLVGLNVGETTLYGKYRNKFISLNVTVTEPVEELVDVALRYPDGVEITEYAGNGEREVMDGPLDDCSFISPEGLAADGDTLYLSDSGVIRMIADGEASSLYLEPDFLTADLVRGWDGDMYVLTGPWEADDEVSYYGILRISDDGADFLYYTEAAWSVIPDFAFSSDGTLWFIQQNMGTGATTLNTLDLQSLEAAWVMDLPDSARGMAYDEADNLYIAVPEAGIIIRVNAGAKEWRYFAGIEGECDFIDGAIPQFYRPTSLVAKDNAVYVLDFDTVRKITVEGEGALFTETLAGIPTADTNPDVRLGTGSEAVLPASELASIALDGEGRLLLSDPKNSVVYEIRLET